MLKTKLLSRTSCSAFLRSPTCGLTTIMIMVSLLLLSPTLAGDRTANTTANPTANYIAHCIASKETQNLQCGCLCDMAAWLWFGKWLVQIIQASTNNRLYDGSDSRAGTLVPTIGLWSVPTGHRTAHNVASSFLDWFPGRMASSSLSNWWHALV